MGWHKYDWGGFHFSNEFVVISIQMNSDSLLCGFEGILAIGHFADYRLQRYSCYVFSASLQINI